MYDPTLDRTCTTGTGNVSDHSISYIDSIELKNGRRGDPALRTSSTGRRPTTCRYGREYKPEAFNQVWIDDYARLITEVGADNVALLVQRGGTRAVQAETAEQQADLVPQHPKGVRAIPWFLLSGLWSG